MSKQEKQNIEQPEESLDHVMQARFEKLQKIVDAGVNPFPYSFKSSHKISDALENFEEFSEKEVEISLPGRIMSMRLMGKASFSHIQEEDNRIQIYVRKDMVGDDKWDIFKLLDIGDIIGVRGHLFTTKTGEKTLKVTSFELLSKNLRPLPAVKEKDGKTWFKWDDKEEKYRKRSVDLIMNQESRDILIKRSLIEREMRNLLNDEGFLEVSTPIMQPLYGGASAKPFVTHYNALDRDFYLRIADELYLKRLIAGGIPRVYEISKDFRNEGIDRFHSPEFTMMECYCAYEDYHYMVNLVEKIVSTLAEKVIGKSEIEYQDKSINLTPPYRRVTMQELIREKCGIEIIGRNRDELAHDAKNTGINIESGWGVGKIIDEIFSEKVEHELIDPTFVMDYPVELSPLAKRHRTTEGLVERFELFIGGTEVANSFTELNDPVDQRKRFEEQARLLSEGDEEAHPIDEDYLQALEVGMPPTAGLGMGIDRLAIVLTGAFSIRDVIFFPTLRPRS